MFKGLFKRKPPEWKAHLAVSVQQPAGLGGLWFYEISGKSPDGTIYKELSRKGYEHIAAAGVAGDIMAGRVYGDAIKRGIVWARLDAPPEAPRVDWREWMGVSVGQPTGAGGLWFWQIAWKGGDGTINKQLSETGYEYESAARETAENTAAVVYDELVRTGRIPAPSEATAASSPAQIMADIAGSIARVAADPVAGPAIHELAARHAVIDTLLIETEAAVAADSTACHGTVDGTWIDDGPAGCEYPTGHAGPHGWDGPY